MSNLIIMLVFIKFSKNSGGAGRDRTDDLRLAKPALSQLSYSPIKYVVGLGRLELPTSRLSGVRSNQLSYRPQLMATNFKPSRPTSSENILSKPNNSSIA